MQSLWLDLNTNAAVLLSLSAIWIAGFLATRVTKLLHLPNVTGYILAGVAIGPYALNLLPQGIVTGMDFVTDAALSFIAFGVGRYLRLDALRRSGWGVIVLTVCEALVAAALVTLTMYYIFHLPLSFSLLLGAIGSATAPASSLMTIRQYRAKGNFVDTLVQVVALDDAVALIAFSVCAAVADAAEHAGAMQTSVVLLPILENLLALGVSAGLGFVLNLLINKRRSKDHRLVLACAFIFGMAALCSAISISPLLSMMMMGTVFSNLHKDKALFKQLNRMTPPILLMFFVLSGMRMNVPALKTAGIIGLAYFFVRIVGKMVGSYFGARASRRTRAVRRYLGLALIPQAGVSIGLAVLAQRLLSPESGQLLSTIILSSSVLYEMIGPLSAKAALSLSRSIGPLAEGEREGEGVPLPFDAFFARMHRRERLGKHENLIYVAGQTPKYEYDPDFHPSDAHERDAASLADLYFESLNEVDRTPNPPPRTTSPKLRDLDS